MKEQTTTATTAAAATTGAATATPTAGPRQEKRAAKKSAAQKTRLGVATWITPFFKKYAGALIIALILGVLTFGFAAALMFTSGYLISRAAETIDNIMVIFTPIMLVRIFGVGKPILNYLERLTSHDWILRMTSSLRLKLYTVLEKDAIFFKRHYRTGDILGLLAEDIGHIQNLYLRTIFPTIVAWVLYVLIIVCLGLFSLWFALVMLLLFGVMVLLVPLVSLLVNGARQTRRKVMKNTLYEQVTDNVLGVNDWIVSGRSGEYVQTYRTADTALRKVDAALFRSSRKRDLVLQIVYALIVVALLLWAGAQFGGAYAGPANWIAAFVLGFFPLIEIFAPLSDAAIETNKYRDSIDRLGALPEAGQPSSGRVAQENSSAPGSDDAQVTKKGTTKEADSVLPHQPPTLQAPFVIECKQVSFRYPDGVRTVLNGLDLSIQPGEKLAILGRSGSGKSTLASLLRGDLLPNKGSITLNGISVSSFGDQIASYLGVIQQQTYLFNTSLAENLRIGNRAASDDDLWDALEQVGLGPTIRRLPRGLKTLVDEAGLRFSGGERHRIALARVLLHNVPVVILDEPTVGLDPMTEQALLDTMFETMHDKTIILITHHLQGVSSMDRVVFIEDGKLTLSGSPAELEKSNPFYQRLQAFDRGVV